MADDERLASMGRRITANLDRLRAAVNGADGSQKILAGGDVPTPASIDPEDPGWLGGRRASGHTDTQWILNCVERLDKSVVGLVYPLRLADRLVAEADIDTALTS